jgi:hypothetical protein
MGQQQRPAYFESIYYQAGNGGSNVRIYSNGQRWFQRRPELLVLVRADRRDMSDRTILRSSDSLPEYTVV